MFHGPSWRGVESIDRVGDDGAVATIRVLPFGALIRDVPDPGFVLDPVVLDAAGQVIGFWTAEHLATGRVIFPYRLDALEIYGPHRRPGEVVTCLASIQLEGDRQVRSDIDVVAEGGRPWLRLVGWEDLRFDLPPGLDPLMLPSRREISEPWPGPIEHVPDSNAFECRRVRTGFVSDRGFWKRVWAHRMLGRAEREQFRRLTIPESRQLEWLAGRAAAKEAVRAAPPVPLLDSTSPSPTSRSMPTTGKAASWPEGPGVTSGRTTPPVVSIGQIDGLAVAVAGLPPASGDDEDGPGARRGDSCSEPPAVQHGRDRRAAADRPGAGDPPGVAARSTR